LSVVQKIGALVDNLWQDTLLMLIGETDPDLSEQVKPG
jgi:hypothetical protein